MEIDVFHRARLTRRSYDKTSVRIFMRIDYNRVQNAHSNFTWQQLRIISAFSPQASHDQLQKQICLKEFNFRPFFY